ncbi:unnamed protein product [Ceratitis capitata]|uniref:(Mediterranean fruit fly) hypothetical protein n=1 Tax=Ceratitis capitata TaxID=7213 RepID=A0A811V8S4_CERCA|nr:unnamed protein product [Ceratitis capitata]
MAPLLFRGLQNEWNKEMRLNGSYRMSTKRLKRQKYLERRDNVTKSNLRLHREIPATSRVAAVAYKIDKRSLITAFNDRSDLLEDEVLVLLTIKPVYALCLPEIHNPDVPMGNWKVQKAINSEKETVSQFNKSVSCHSECCVRVASSQKTLSDSNERTLEEREKDRSEMPRRRMQQRFRTYIQTLTYIYQVSPLDQQKRKEEKERSGTECGTRRPLVIGRLTGWGRVVGWWWREQPNGIRSK